MENYTNFDNNLFISPYELQELLNRFSDFTSPYILKTALPSRCSPYCKFTTATTMFWQNSFTCIGIYASNIPVLLMFLFGFSWIFCSKCLIVWGDNFKFSVHFKCVLFSSQSCKIPWIRYCVSPISYDVKEIWQRNQTQTDIFYHDNHTKSCKKKDIHRTPKKIHIIIQDDNVGEGQIIRIDITPTQIQPVENKPKRSVYFKQNNYFA